MIDVDISLRRGGFALEARFTARAPGVTCVFGPSGAGKTTLLRAIAGLERPTRGAISVEGAALTDVAAGVRVPPESRRIACVFQDGRLFPHLSVRENLLYGWERAPDRRLALGDVVDALGVAALLDRAPRALSGGERQRVALGRALLAQPRLILMDEPMSGVDAARKGEILQLIRTVRARFSCSILYVSHDLEETAALADDLVLMDRGGVAAFGPAAKLLADADLTPLTDRPDARTIFDLPLLDPHAGLGLAAYGAGEARLLAPLIAAAVDAPVRFQVHARDVTLALSPPADISVRNLVPAEIVSIRARRDGQRLLTLATALGPMLAIVTQEAVAALALTPGKRVTALVKAVALH